MALFCAEFAWCSPDAYRAIVYRDYLQLREYLVKKYEANSNAR